MSAYFITSCGTDIGKTFIMTALCWHLSKSYKVVHAIKPVISGWSDANILDNDTGKILCSLSMDCHDSNITKVSPWRLYYPHAPNIAAKLENTKLDYNKIVTFCSQCISQAHDYLLIEGVGGVMSPITDDKTCLDIIRDLNINVILVIGSYLGSISHTLTALKVLSGMSVKVVLTLKDNNVVNVDDIVKFIYEYTGKTVYIQRYVTGSFDLWKGTSDNIVNFISADNYDKS
ncbi:dethiobiotin synthase [Ehrlichia chaffeensis str. Heartland]|uniref:ATP-dependent dethiobiotin synthetase BioD n=1 Tax=Ehrlichia chaffeensis (strain ATCC CRL-10679 / Arkansas) TaxID=205920 RepID=Q2GF89_EHRCR|nr:dethiobiotin synthase [Ehrlichia chaffeensis]ABD45520.1 dethiobiotin synthetase [Ehrlichia chaffeensis str. Arkansas]AHX03248.1 dethiobiotin synthase [Ehrlichia chaffeensis str. Heartland]AHX05164.1 dethiobiotin synthase [Ehrlichia chaffeensis str. Jax]AHX06153.1 dethiobiotin synthase [Ehrlichia chaffeensis str. Liberty]AHX08064.1 dethiobiotin synthase [Ehrlichia chaffeensis str. Saint Vincent]